MKTAISLVSLTWLFLAFGSATISAQTPVPDPDTISNPIQEGDPALRTMPPRLDYVEDRKRIMADELPGPVRQTLESSAQYQDWQRAVIYHDENKDEYEVEFKEGEKTTSYRFNREGRPVLEEE